MIKLVYSIAARGTWRRSVTISWANSITPQRRCG